MDVCSCTCTQAQPPTYVLTSVPRYHLLPTKPTNAALSGRAQPWSERAGVSCLVVQRTNNPPPPPPTTCSASPSSESTIITAHCLYIVPLSPGSSERSSSPPLPLPLSPPLPRPAPRAPLLHGACSTKSAPPGPAPPICSPCLQCPARLLPPPAPPPPAPPPARPAQRPIPIPTGGRAPTTLHPGEETADGPSPAAPATSPL